MNPDEILKQAAGMSYNRDTKTITMEPSTFELCIRIAQEKRSAPLTPNGLRIKNALSEWRAMCRTWHDLEESGRRFVQFQAFHETAVTDALEEALKPPLSKAPE